jgi:hypothetical protein
MEKTPKNERNQSDDEQNYQRLSLTRTFMKKSEDFAYGLRWSVCCFVHVFMGSQVGSCA